MSAHLVPAPKYFDLLLQDIRSSVTMFFLISGCLSDCSSFETAAACNLAELLNVTAKKGPQDNVVSLLPLTFTDHFINSYLVQDVSV